MKTRIGFVSNSSSSSFVIWNSERTTAQVMRDMLKLVKAEWKEEKVGRKPINAITKCIKWLQTNYRKDMPLLYPGTCNYETWIYKDKYGNLFVETCNNHDGNWQSMDNIIPLGDDNDEKLPHIRKKLEFLDLSNMKTKTYDEFNKEWEEKFATWMKSKK